MECRHPHGRREAGFLIASAADAWCHSPLSLSLPQATGWGNGVLHRGDVRCRLRRLHAVSSSVMRVDDAASIHDLAALARRRLPDVIWDFLDGGAEDEVTIGWNRAAFRAYRFRPNVLTGNGQRDLGIDLFGTRLAAPFMIGPTGLNGIYWPDADLHMATAAAQAGIAFALSTAANNSIEQVGALSPGMRFFQLYPWGDPALSGRLIERAADAGYAGLILTVDSLIAGNRERDVHNRFAHSVTISPRTVLDGLRHPSWLASTWIPRGMPRLENIAEFLPLGADAYALARFGRQQRNESYSWNDAAKVREQWGGPLIIKGVLSVADVQRARSLGADAVVVSNHGGRGLDGAIATLDALPSVVQAAGNMVVLIDGGFRRGSDIVKALALGARCVLLGRATLYGVAAGGPAGVAKAISLLRSETDRVMGLLGCASVAEITAELVERA